MPARPPQPAPPRPDQFRAILPQSLAGWLWAAAALVAGPVLVLVVMEIPVQLLADRLPDTGSGSIVFRSPIAEDRFFVVLGGLLTVALWVGLLTSHHAVPEVPPSRRWTSFVPGIYCLLGGIVGVRAGLVVENLGAERFSFTTGMVPALAQTGVLLGVSVVGMLLARQAARHLPNQASGRVRTSWVGSVPVGLPCAAAHAVLPLLQLVLNTLAGYASLGLMLALFLAVGSYWMLGSTDVVVTPSELRVVRGARAPFSWTGTLSLADVTHVEIVQVSTARAVTASRLGGGRCFAYRRGPALRVSHQDRVKWPAPWLLGMPSPEEAEHAARVIRTWREAATTA